MTKLWAGVTAGETDPLADDFNSSLRFDRRLFREDIRGSMAHAAMLCRCGILSDEESDALRRGLTAIGEALEAGTLAFDESAEDIHMFVEQELTRRLGDTGKKLHTARSRNDQVALDLRLWLREACAGLRTGIEELIRALTDRAEENGDAILPGYTHLQRAQPVNFGHHLMAYAMMFLRDRSRLADAAARMDVSPIGSCALAGTTYPTDRD